MDDLPEESLERYPPAWADYDWSEYDPDDFDDDWIRWQKSFLRRNDSVG